MLKCIIASKLSPNIQIQNRVLFTQVNLWAQPGKPIIFNQGLLDKPISKTNRQCVSSPPATLLLTFSLRNACYEEFG